MRGGKRQGEKDIEGRYRQGEKNIEGSSIGSNIDEIILDEMKASDVGGGDRSPCSPAIPRGCVGCVVCRTRSVPSLVRVS